MKQSLKVFSIFITILFMAISCNKEKITKSNGQLQFSFAQKMASNSGGRVAATATPTFALLSIKDSQGTLVQSSKKIALYNFGGSFVTESLQLNVGSYSLTQFMILDSANNVLYATPMEGSDLAQYVTDPLPINFSITANGTTLVTPQVMAVTPQTPPESFGYVSFGFEVVTTTNKPKLKEIWTNEGFSILYKTYYFYSGSLPIKFTTYLYTDVVNLIDSTILHYNNLGQLVQDIRYSVFNPEPPITRSYEYDNIGRLIKMYYTGDLSSNDCLYEYSYDPANSLITAERRLKNSPTTYLLANSFYEYKISSQGDVEQVSMYTESLALGKTLKFKANYTYDNELNPLAFTQTWGNGVYSAPISNRHNVLSYQLVFYSLSNGTLTPSDSCTVGQSYQYNGLGQPTSAKVLNPDGCTEGYFDGTTFTYFYQ